MQYVNLLGMHPSFVGLRPFAKSFFEALGVNDGEERESGNYVDGYYFKGSLGNMTFSVAISDEDVHEDLPYWIHISADLVTPDALDDAVFQLIRDKVLPMGFQLARIVNFGKRGEQRIDY
ncbi:hypothetical protein [Pseudomonas sp. St290]|uniref:hypothetical protein n=1 Tax=Pseudomonas sp. St290 TaxID=1602166 RepID=UPI001BEE204F|nr:hypothetical protein [Pseudomonas sp. St290]BBH33905.1 hypothetical protein PBDP_3442 [Pseudomonas sp. St290]